MRRTLDESWYRVAPLRLRLLPCVQPRRQHYRGRIWFVLQDPVTAECFRISLSAWHFMGLLEGKTSVGKAWEHCLEKHGDDAPTQGEVIRLLQQLHQAGMLAGERSPDADTLLDQRKERIKREVTGRLRSILFSRFPLFDPDRLLTLIAAPLRPLFSIPGFILWLGIIIYGLVLLANNADKMGNSTQAVLSLSNMPWLYLCFVGTKVIHEMAHGIAVKVFAKREGVPGEVRSVGVMLMLLTPIPFVDCTSGWTLRSKWQRILIGAAGMMAELMLAVAAIYVWVSAPEGYMISALAYNVIFVAGISTVMFNGNPLLRYDAYYMLSDLLEIPNLNQKSTQHFLGLCKRWIFGMKKVPPVAREKREAFWLFFYSIAAWGYRLWITVAITLMISEILFFVGVIFAVAAGYRMILQPIWKYIKWVWASQELDSHRLRAGLITTLVFLSALWGFVIQPFPDRLRFEAVCEPHELQQLHCAEPGYLKFIIADGELLKKGELICEFTSYELEQQIIMLEVRRNQLKHRLRQALADDRTAANIFTQQLLSLEQKEKMLAQRGELLKRYASVDGIWYGGDIQFRLGQFIPRGSELGLVIPKSGLFLRGAVPQRAAALLNERVEELEFRRRLRPESLGKVTSINLIQTGQQQLPSAALGYQGGGEIQEAAPGSQKQGGGNSAQASEKVFEALMEVDAESAKTLRPGQVCIVRCNRGEMPLYLQGWRWVKSELQYRFKLL